MSARHESLRTVFGVEDGQPYQHIIPAGEATVPVTVTAAAAGELAALVAAAVRHEFDLAAELPVRAWLFTLGRAEQEHVLLLLCHHIASDGWSVQVLMADLAAAYAARETGGHRAGAAAGPVCRLHLVAAGPARRCRRGRGRW
jgi:hypothetical protein